MQRDSAATRARILDAATAEFAEHGLAGARVDRIAAGAGANKQLIYAYFGSKDGLLDAVVEANLAALMDSVPFDADDLPRYAGTLYDFGLDHPELTRLARFHGLQRPGMLLDLPAAAASMTGKVAALAEAQAAGRVDGSLPPHRLLQLLLAIVHGSEEFAQPSSDPVERAAQRDAVTHAVRRLVAPQ